MRPFAPKPPAFQFQTLVHLALWPLVTVAIRHERQGVLVTKSSPRSMAALSEATDISIKRQMTFCHIASDLQLRSC